MIILSIDDDHNYQETLVKLLTKLSKGLATIWIAGTLQTGIDLAKEKNPAVVLLDMTLPDSQDYRDTIQNGVPEFVKLGIPVIVVTCQDLDFFADDYAIPLEAYLAGASRVYPKPLLTKMLPWLNEVAIEGWAARLLGDAGTIYLKKKITKEKA